MIILKLISVVYRKKRENIDLENEYSHFSKRQLKKLLKELKSNQMEKHDEIRYVSKLIRKKYNEGDKILNTKNHNESVAKNIWSYCKDIFEKSDIIINQILIRKIARSILKKTISKIL